jgi:hypothetical protein
MQGEVCFNGGGGGFGKGKGGDTSHAVGGWGEGGGSIYGPKAEKPGGPPN